MGNQAYADQLNQTEKKKLLTVLDNIEISSESNTYNGKDLKVLFKFWKKLFPSNKMSMNCGGCRKSVFKFFNEIGKTIKNK